MEGQYHLNDIISEFAITGSIANTITIETGHINDTYRLINADAAAPDYLLQRINRAVFKDVPALMENIWHVTQHLKSKLPTHEAVTHAVTVVKLHDGGLYHKDHSGNYWRMLHFIKDTRSYDLVTTAQQAYQGGKAFGRFQSMLTDLDATLLHNTIPDFHNMVHRLEQLEEAVNNNLKGKVGEVTAELEFIDQRSDRMCGIFYMGEAGHLPWRLTHNDTKFHNVLLDKTDSAQCVVDLDTVMPGYVAYDFGDSVRTIINTAAEDEADLSKIQLNIPLFEAYVKGYFQEAGHFLTDREVESLMMGVMMMPFIQAVRFLTDHLSGDIYFKVHQAGHNLQRARAQLQLVRKLEESEPQLQAIIDAQTA
ncbi:phosphotransferase enzyme family protein [Mucilaginibacter sp.]|uniref:phosphotransferase enzyme family protein n=1 Tax=Mucilaginibacter sp. TaxID=1882438 RepID=UPI0035BC6281